MPIAVTCAGCAAKMNAPDAAAGKKIKCPKCQAVCAVPPPAFEVVEDPVPEVAKPAAAVAADPPRPKKSATEGEADRPRGGAKPARNGREDSPPRRGERPPRDERDDDHRPRRRDENRPGQKAGGRAALLIGGILAGVFLLAGGAFSVYWFSYRPKLTGPPPQTVALDNWEEYTSPGNVFKAQFPGKPEQHVWKPAGDLKVSSDIRQHRTGETRLGKSNVTFFAGYIRFPDGVRPGEIDDAKKWLTTLHAAPAEFNSGKSAKKVTVAGREWDEEKMVVPRYAAGSTGVVRWHVSGPFLYVVGSRSEYQAPPTEAVEKFFASFELLGGDPGDPDPDPVSLDNWQTYTSPGGAFKASFPGGTKEMISFSVDGTKSADFREYTATDARGRTRTYFAGFATFDKKPTPEQQRKVREVVRNQSVGRSANGQRRVAFGGWPWGEEYQQDPNKTVNTGGSSGICRLIEVGATVYAAGINSSRYPREKEIEQFFAGFEVLGTKPDANDLRMPPDWAEYRPPGGEFRTAMPRQVHLKDEAYKGKDGPSFAGVTIDSFTAYEAHDAVGGDLLVCVVRFRPNTAEADRQKVMNRVAETRTQPGGRDGEYQTKKVSWAGREAVEITHPKTAAITRMTHDADAGFVAVSKLSTPSPDITRAFLDNFSFDKDPPPLDPKNPPGWHWSQFPTEGYQVLMPSGTGSSNTSLALTAAQRKTAESARVYRRADATAAYMVLRVQFVPGTTAEARQAVMNELTALPPLIAQNVKLDTRNPINWTGRDALEHVYTPAGACAGRQTLGETTGYAAVVVAQKGTLNADRVKLFLDSFTLEKK